MRNYKKRQWKFKNIALLILSLVVAYLLLQSSDVKRLFEGLGNLGYLGSFLTGMMFSYAMTTAPATSIILLLGKQLAPLLISAVGAAGALFSDYIIFRFVRSRLLDEIEQLTKEINNVTDPFSNLIMSKRARIRVWRKVSRSRVLRALVPVFAGFIIASPLPDELGVALFAAVKFKIKRFLLVSYSLNFAGIFVIASIGSI